MDDRALWIAFETSSSDEERRRCAARLIEQHLGFIRSYAAKTRFPYWTDTTFNEYVQELVCETLRRLDGYNRRHRGHEGRLVSFPTYLKPYLQPVRWTVAGREAPLPVGRETRRMRADAQRFIRSHQQASGGDDPSWAEVAEAVGKAHGKKISGDRIRRITNPPTVVSGDGSAGESDDAQLWDRNDPDSTGVDDDVIETLSREASVTAVHAAVLEEAATPLERAIVHLRLMAAPRETVDGMVRSPGPMSHQVLAQRHGVTPGHVGRVEAALTARLRARLEGHSDPRLTRE